MTDSADLPTSPAAASAPHPSGKAAKTGAKAVTATPGMALLQRLFIGADDPATLLGAFAQGMCTLPHELGDMGQRLQVAHDEQDWARYGRLLRQLIDKYIRTIEPAPSHDSHADQLRGMLANTLDAVLANLVRHSPELEPQVQHMGQQMRIWRDGQPLEPMARQLRELCHQVGVRGEGMQEQHDLLLGLFAMLLDNITELLDAGSWLQAQIRNVRELLAGPLDATSLEQTRSELRAGIYRQGLLRDGISESKQAMKALMVDFIDQVDGMASETSEFHDRLASYAIAVREARSIADLNQLLQDVLQDTTRVQAQAARARDQLSHARAEANAAEQRVRQLEEALEQADNALRTDPLTGALSRCGLQELFASALPTDEAPLSIAMLDLDHFGQTNTAFGRAAGDRALRHLVGTVQARVGNKGQIARLGGDEFVLVLPGATQAQARSLLRSLQHALSQRPFLFENQRVHVRFSVGIAQWQAEESSDQLLHRADRALRAAKQAGRDQIRSAERTS